MVKVTILDMTAESPADEDKVDVYYLEKGSTIDLEDLVDSIGMIGITTDGTKLYFANDYIPVELTYRIYGTEEVFDFSQPINEDVVIEPVVGMDGSYFNMQDLEDIKESFDSLFGETTAATEAAGE